MTVSVSGLQEDEEEEEEEEKILHRYRTEKGRHRRMSTWSQNVNMFILVFMTGVASASLIALLVAGIFGHAPTKARIFDAGQVLLPDADHLRVVDESRYFSTQVKPAVRPGENSSGGSSKADGEAEVMANLHAAEIFWRKGNVEKAAKLFKHALALSPKHPAVLNLYGEFLIENGDDMVEADHMFVRALAFSQRGSDENSRALTNRQKTATLVEELDMRMLKSIDAKKKAFLKISANCSSMRRAKREAYYQHIYHTVGIEGNTMSLAQTRVLLETKLAIGGKSLVEHNEVLGLDAALKYINQTLVDVEGYITRQHILEIHKRVIGYVDPTEAGLFRRTQVYVGDHIPPHPEHIDALIDRFLVWLNDPVTREMHPVRLAALAHYKLVYIHPFVDGNGRTSRLLMNWILMRNGFPPVIVRKQDRLTYYQHLVTANDGDIRPFVRFIGRCAARTVDAYLWATKENSLVPFTEDDPDNVIPVTKQDAINHLDSADKIIMGGSLGDNVTVEP